MKRWCWLEAADLIAMHREVVAEFGGPSGLRDEALLESAAARPKNLAAYGPASVFELAAAYAYGLARNHPFIDGNKRIGHAAMETFLVCNGYEINAPVDEQEAVILRVASGQMSREELTQWLTRCLTPRA